MIDLDDDNDKLRKKIADLEATITEQRSEIEQLKKTEPEVEPVGDKSGWNW